MDHFLVFLNFSTLWICVIGNGLNTIPAIVRPRLQIPSRDRNCLNSYGIFPDPGNCRKYYECYLGKAYRKDCPPHTGFDEHYSVCVHAYNVECGGRGGIHGTLAPPHWKRVVKNVVKEPEPVIHVDSAIEFQCKKEYSMVPDLDNCWGFYVCSRGNALWKKCPNNTAYDENLKLCVHAAFVDCHGRGGIQGSPTSQGTDLQKTSVLKHGQCPRAFGIFPDTEDCMAFYECSYGLAKKKICPKNTAFDEYLSVCGYQDDVNCGDRRVKSGVEILPSIIPKS